MRRLSIVGLIAIRLSLFGADEVSLEDLPETVKEAMERVAKGAELSKCEKVVGANGKVVYIARYLRIKGKDGKEGKEAVVAVSEDGKVVRNGREHEIGSKDKAP